LHTRVLYPRNIINFIISVHTKIRPTGG